MTPIIRVEKLAKLYRIGQREPYKMLRDRVANSLLAPLRHLGSRVRESADRRSENGKVDDATLDFSANGGHIWALKDVSFEVAQGEVLGVIGRNGAGKSTLLKILSRITEPTAGRVELRGRVGSLLEVGTGFHQELTGRENIHLSGAILGMKRAEIRRKFDEIVGFAEVEKFVDTPVKHYSSGMYVRLAFAVAAHLETEILLVDEVLAVGDVAFQKKCLGKMDDVARQGRTVLFVSHNMPSIESLCSSCLLFAGGCLAAKGEPGWLVTQYMASQMDGSSGQLSLVDHASRRRGSAPIMTSVSLSSGPDGPSGVVRAGASLSIRVSFSSPQPLRPVLGVTFKTSHSAPVFTVSDRYCNQLAFCEPTCRGTVVCDIEKLPLLPGKYFLDLWLGDLTSDLDVIFDALSFEVTPADLLGTGRLPPTTLGAVFCKATWRLRDGADQ